MTVTASGSRHASRHGRRWTLLAELVGFLASFLLSSFLHVSRALFLAGYVVVVTSFVAPYVSSQRIQLRGQLERHWIAGVGGGLVIGALLARQLLAQPASARAAGLALAGHLTFAYLLTGNPLAAIIAHVRMHGAAVIHGMGTTMQLPPHY